MIIDIIDFGEISYILEVFFPICHSIISYIIGEHHQIDRRSAQVVTAFLIN